MKPTLKRCTFDFLLVYNILKYFCVLIWLVSSVEAFSQNAPILRCISLDTNDDVTLYWQQPTDTGADFNQFLIYYSSGMGAPFTILSQITDFNQSSVLVNGSFAGAGRFYIVQVYNGFADTSLAGDTIAPIVVGISSEGKRVSLGWNHSGLPSQDSIYRVYKLDTSGNWNLIKALDYPGTAAQDSIFSCAEEVTYRVETKGRGGCISRSNTVKKLVIDEEPPRRVNIQTASVDTATGFVNIEWNRSKSADTYGYLVFYFEDFVRTDTVFGADNLTFQFTKFGIDALVQAETLSVAPFDSCLNAASTWYNQAPDSLRFSTIFIDTLGYDRCAGRLNLAWSFPADPFRLAVRFLESFRIYRRTNNGPSELIGTVAGTDSTFSDNSLVPGNLYTYVVAGVHAVSGKEALSNKLDVNLKALNVPEQFYISSVKNHHPTGVNRIHVLSDATSEASTYGLYRSLPETDDFMLVERISADLPSNFFIEDLQGDASQSAYQYWVAAFDRCGEMIAQTQVVKSIYVSGEKDVRDLMNAFSWNPYQGFDTLGSGILAYDVYRIAGAEVEDQIATYPQPAMHMDDISRTPNLSGDVCYYVQALEDGFNSFGVGDTSISNLLCFKFPVLAFVPTAFSPDQDDLNDIFLPVVNFVQHDKYDLTIYDRTGRLVFQSTDSSEGWNGKGMPNGTYVYKLTLVNFMGETISQAGSVHLIR